MSSVVPSPSLPSPSHHYGGYPTNPYLDYRPVFARSLPVQILVTGITLTLICVLLIQLLFSAPSHIRIAPANFFLQVSAAVALLAWVIACLVLVLNETVKRSQSWPFMLDYIAIDFPPLVDPRNHGTWSNGGLVAWLFMNAMVSALTQMTHIQFLTLIYPSPLETRLIFLLLGPLAILAALTQFAPLHGHMAFIDMAGDVRNVCNATLTILFTIFLSFWGFFLHRKQAWRTDGGTAAFGVGAILLALASTAITIAYIPERDQFEWVPGLTGAIVLWQSFLGWWWWVGAGMGMHEIDEWLQRAEKRRRRRVARAARKQERKDRLRGAWNAMTGGTRGATSTSTGVEKAPSNITTRRHGASSDSDSQSLSSKSDDMPSKGHRSDKENSQRGSYWPWSLTWSAYHYVRNAHVTASRRRAIERAEHIREVFGVDGSPTNVPAASGWGLGSFGIREREAAEAAFEMETVGRLVRPSRSGVGVGEPETEGEGKDEGEGEAGRDARPRRHDVERPHPQSQTKQTPVETPSSSSLWWWGPLRRWRLQDTTEYSERS